jgi:hypothetical protein
VAYPLHTTLDTWTLLTHPLQLKLLRLAAIIPSARASYPSEIVRRIFVRQALPGTGMTLNSASGLPVRVRILVLPSATSRLLCELLGGVRLWFLMFPPFELHVNSST